MHTDLRIANAGSWFVSSWLLGLFVAPSAPAPDAPDAVIAAHFADHGFATALQSLLIHGIAGVALIVLAVTLRAGRGATIAGLAAGVTSLVQAAIGIATSTYLATHAGAATTARAFDAVNVADTVKLLFLAAFIWTVSRTMGPRMRRAGAVIAPLQAVSGLAFVTGSSALYALLYLALPLLLAWTGTLAYRAWRTPQRAPRSISPLS